jgi:hypothetical protein
MMETLFHRYARMMNHEDVNHPAYLKSAICSHCHKNIKIPRYAKTN